MKVYELYNRLMELTENDPIAAANPVVIGPSDPSDAAEIEVEDLEWGDGGFDEGKLIIRMGYED